MAVAHVFSSQPGILEADMVTIETDLSRGLYSFSIVGLPGKAVEEARDRISSAIKNSGFKSPKSHNHKIIISLAPADLKKEGPVFDLPMAVAYLLSSGEMRADVKARVFVGELSLDGALRPIKGILPIVRSAREHGFQEIVVPYDNREEAALIPDIVVTPARSLVEVIRHIDESRDDHKLLDAQDPTQISTIWDEGTLRLEDVRGQETAKRGLIIAAAGRHNVIMVGPPGTGKTMLARVFQNLLPPLSIAEALEVTSIHSVAGTDTGISAKPPFRAPHHTASHTSLVGGGTHPKPGEVTLAHRGVLFLDEFPEFERRSIDALRQPLEDRVVSISRVHSSVIFPADFIMLAAMNPSRGGDEHGDYALQMLETYKHKVSGPILDRIDLWLPVPRVDYDTLTSVREDTSGGETATARAQIRDARTRQKKRFDGLGITTNGEMSARVIEERVPLSETAQTLLKQSAQKLHLSPRSYHRLIKVSRTIADLENSEDIAEEHILEALNYRVKLQ